MKKYIKFFGTNGSGKTTMIRELSKVLSGHVCDNWEKTEIPPIIAYSHCDCNKVASIGFWKADAKRNGMDPLHQNKKFQTMKKYKNGNEKLVFNFKDKIEKGQIDSNINAEIIFEDGIVTYSEGIHNALAYKFELYTFHLDYPLEVCIQHYTERGSVIDPEKDTVGSIERKHKEATELYNRLKVNKFKLFGTIDENVAKVLQVTGIKPCNCMKDKVIYYKVQEEVFVKPKVAEKSKKRSLFED
jgi:hypothetical protein